MATYLTVLIFITLFCDGTCRAFQKHQHKIQEISTTIQSETEAICTETLLKVLNNFVLRLSEFVMSGDITWNMF
jgi:hypothetical protein